MIGQRIKVAYNQMDAAVAYYRTICAVNKIPITKKQVYLLAFTAVRGSITNPAAREEFCSTYKSSKATVNNMISALSKKKLFVKNNNKIGIYPIIALDFNQPISLRIDISYVN